MEVKKLSINIGEEKLTLETGKYGPSADVMVYATLGETCVLVSLVCGTERRDINYFPLYVEYVEKLYAGGKIKGSRWVKREGKPSDDAILTRRLIDRGIRPLFPKKFKKEVQIIITLLSVDGVNSPEIVSSIAASAALHLSSIPWNGPLSTIRIGYVKAQNGDEHNLIINPTEEVQKFSNLDLVVTSNKEKVVMIETQAEQVSEEVIVKGIEIALEENKKIIEFIEEFRKLAGKEKDQVEEKKLNEDFFEKIKTDYKKDFDILLKSTDDKTEEKTTKFKLIDKITEKYKDEYDRNVVVKTIEDIIHHRVREMIIKDKKRVDGRALDEIREIKVETSLLPRTHGSALFQRGKTQVMSIATLGAPTLEQLIEGPEGNEAKKYMHHYFMPPYSVGEVGRTGWPSPREIGHGALAEKALEPVLPNADEFPYVIRIVSEVLSSNGSTSMASTCGSTLALMDAGVPIKLPVAGISVGLIYQDDSHYQLLTDIAGIEDFSGDMDFKVAGTVAGITAIQLDIKNQGLTMEIVKGALVAAKKARLFILDEMKKVISVPRQQLSKYAPKVIILTPPEDKIGEIIGPGGKNIRNIIAKTGAEIDITDDGKVSISGTDQNKVDEAAAIVKNIYRKINIGEAFEGTVKRLLPFGAFVEILPGKEGMIHVSKLSSKFIKDPGEVVTIGQTLSVKVAEIDFQGRINLILNK